MSRAKSVGDVLREEKGVGPGFDYIRLILAILVFHGHTSAIASGRPEERLLIAVKSALPEIIQWRSWRDPLYILIVPSFFALSGFLVAGSAFRLRNVRSFLIFRGLRIIPALTIEVMLSAIVLGPVFTSLDIHGYFGSSEFYKYFGNIVGVVDFYLPGVFELNPVPRIVNNSLWTLPPEFYCYLLLSATMLIGLLYSTRLFSLLFLAATVVMIWISLQYGLGQPRGNLPASVIVYYFFMGCLFYIWKDRVVIRPEYVIACLIVGYAASYTRYVMVAPIFVTYLVVAAGVAKWPAIPFVRKGDYSYGIYLYHFPIAQALIAALPSFVGHPYYFKLLAFGVTALFAVLSWHLLERPALRLKTRFVQSKRELLPNQLVES